MESILAKISSNTEVDAKTIDNAYMFDARSFSANHLRMRKCTPMRVADVNGFELIAASTFLC